MGAAGQIGKDVGAAARAASRVEALLAAHGPALMRTAHQFSLCRDDALDAYQRALEIYLRRLETVEVATEGAWMRVVVKHEAMAIRRARSVAVESEDVDFDATVPAAGRDVDERVAAGERVDRSVEALRALKPDEAKALMLKAEGLSYDEIGRRFGWTYTKVNRSITEGRARFMKTFRAIESGEACEEHAEVLAALATGTATSAQVVAIRPHLRHCTACRATVRDLHLSRRARLAVLLPFGTIVRFFGGAGAASSAPGAGSGGTRPGSAVLDELARRGGIDVSHGSGAVGSTVPGTPEALGDIVPSVLGAPPVDTLGAHVVVGGSPRGHGTGTAGEHAGRLHPLQLRHDLAQVIHRFNSSDVATGIQIATSSTGGRIGTLGVVVGFCVSGLGAGAVCVVTGVVENPLPLFEQHHVPPGKPRAPVRPEATHEPARLAEKPLRASYPVPAPTPRPRPVRHVVRAAPQRVVVVHRATSTPPMQPTRPTAAQDPSQGTGPTAQEHAPISPAPSNTAGGAQEFTVESAAPAAPPTPAAAPANGGGEFSP